MVINDGHAVDLPGNTVFGDVCNVTDVSLPHFSKRVLFKGFPVTRIRVSGRFQVVVAYKMLYGIYTDSVRNETVLYEFPVDLCGSVLNGLVAELFHCAVRKSEFFLCNAFVVCSG